MLKTQLLVVIALLSNYSFFGQESLDTLFSIQEMKKYEYLIIDIKYERMRQTVTLDFFNGIQKKRVYVHRDSIYNKSRLEKKGYDVFVINNLKRDNKIVMRLLNEFVNFGWSINRHSKIESYYSDGTVSGGTTSASYILKKRT